MTGNNLEIKMLFKYKKEKWKKLDYAEWIKIST